MKRTILTSVSVIAILVGSSAAFAQGSRSNVTQSGGANVADVDQRNSTSNSESNINQSGVSANAEVDQAGANQRSSVTQSGGGTVKIDQAGSRGSTSNVTTSADDRAPESRVDVTQRDDNTSSAGASEANRSNVVQDNVNGFGASGTGSTVRVNQTHNSAGAAQNFSDVQQGRNAESGQVTVDQIGGNNRSFYRSTTSRDNDANITQNGTNNFSDVQQDFQRGAALAQVFQTNNAGGADNAVVIDQISPGFTGAGEVFALGADAIAIQNGAGNSSNISQTGFSETDATSNFARSNQVGDSNSSGMNQSGVDNTADLFQEGNSNNSGITQSGNSNTALVLQRSSGNSSSILQSGNGNGVTIQQ